MVTDRAIGHHKPTSSRGKEENRRYRACEPQPFADGEALSEENDGEDAGEDETQLGDGGNYHSVAVSEPNGQGHIARRRQHAATERNSIHRDNYTGSIGRSLQAR